MAHFAKLTTDNIVETIVVVNNNTLDNLSFPESEQIGIDFLNSIYENTIWKQTSYNSLFRLNYASVGGIYDPQLDGFLPVKRYPSWVLDPLTFQWTAPVPKPQEKGIYNWNETTLSWYKVEI